MLNSPVDEIKNKLDIVEVVGSYIKLQKAGANLRALCPFHSEKKPSFFVSPARQMWHCFGCSKGGDIFAFVKEIEGVEFGDALRILAQKAGVDLKPLRPELKTERKRLYEICEWAAKFFEKQLEASKVGQEAKNYLLARKITEESIKKWRVGYAPDAWQGLSDFLVGKGYEREEIEKAGLAIKSANSEQRTMNNYYDRFRSRIMFPIFDLNSQVVGFGGRIFGDAKRPDGQEEAKYINTPSTLLYDKSRILYGLDRARVEIRKKDECVLVEGYTDVIMSHQAGVENVAATSGTALTLYQLKILKRYSENLLISFDMDVAGDSATKRGIDLAIEAGFNVRVITLPEEKDPADVISQNPDEWQKLIERKKSIMEFYFGTAFAGFSGTAEEKKKISKIVLPIIKRIPNKIEQAHWIQLLAKKLEVKEENVESELKKISQPRPEFPSLAEDVRIIPPQKTRKELMEERIVSLVLKSPSDIGLIEENYFNCFSSLVREVLTNLKNTPNVSLANLPSVFGQASPQLADLLNRLCFKAEFEDDQIEPKQEIQTCLREIFSFETKNKLDCLSREIKKAENEKDFPRVSKLIEEFSKLSKELI